MVSAAGTFSEYCLYQNTSMSQLGNTSAHSAYSTTWGRKPSEKRKLCWQLNAIRSASLSPDRRLRLLCLPSPNLNCINSHDYELMLNWTNC